MSHLLPYDEIEFDENVTLEDISNTPDASDFGYFVEADIKNSDKMKQKTKNLPFSPENKVSPQDKFTKHFIDIGPDASTKNRKLLFNWTDKKII